jgi:hypothetical protein
LPCTAASRFPSAPSRASSKAVAWPWTTFGNPAKGGPGRKLELALPPLLPTALSFWERVNTALEFLYVGPIWGGMGISILPSSFFLLLSHSCGLVSIVKHPTLARRTQGFRSRRGLFSLLHFPCLWRTSSSVSVTFSRTLSGARGN